PAALYTPPPAALTGLDDTHRQAVTALTTSIHSVQLLQIHPGADKAATLAALADTAHHHNKRVVALTGTNTADEHTYADTTTTIEGYRDDLTAGRHTPPLGSLVIVDDANTLTAAQLRWLAHSSAATNTKLVLIGGEEPQPAHTLLAVLTHDAARTQHLGTPRPGYRQPPTAIERAEHHLAATNTPGPGRDRAAHLLRQRSEVIAQLHDIAAVADRLDAIAERDRARGRHRDRDSGLEL
ncbi:AAA family ATPase, partial [Mycobacterium avium]